MRAMRNMADILGSIGDELMLEFDEIARKANEKYRAYPAEILVEHDPRAAASNIYAHMVAEADRRFIGRKNVRSLDIRTQKLWLFEAADVVVRFKKMDEDGRTANYPTPQAIKFDKQLELPGSPFPPIRITAGYTLDKLGKFNRTQVSMPNGKSIEWCVAVNPELTEAVWYDVTRQKKAKV